MIGTFYICKGSEGDYQVCFDTHELGTYETIPDAIEALAYDSSLTWIHPEMGDPLDPSDLGIPDDISGWKPV